MCGRQRQLSAGRRGVLRALGDDTERIQVRRVRRRGELPELTSRQRQVHVCAKLRSKSSSLRPPCWLLLVKVVIYLGGFCILIIYE